MVTTYFRMDIFFHSCSPRSQSGMLYIGVFPELPDVGMGIISLPWSPREFFSKLAGGMWT
jgi:hypothetical protein